MSKAVQNLMKISVYHNLCQTKVVKFPNYFVIEDVQKFSILILKAQKFNIAKFLISIPH